VGFSLNAAIMPLEPLFLLHLHTLVPTYQFARAETMRSTSGFHVYISGSLFKLFTAELTMDAKCVVADVPAVAPG